MPAYDVVDDALASTSADTTIAPAHATVASDVLTYRAVLHDFIRLTQEVELVHVTRAHRPAFDEALSALFALRDTLEEMIEPAHAEHRSPPVVPRSPLSTSARSARRSSDKSDSSSPRRRRHGSSPPVQLRRHASTESFRSERTPSTTALSNSAPLNFGTGTFSNAQPGAH